MIYTVELGVYEVKCEDRATWIGKRFDRVSRRKATRHQPLRVKIVRMRIMTALCHTVYVMLHP